MGSRIRLAFWHVFMTEGSFFMLKKNIQRYKKFFQIGMFGLGFLLLVLCGHSIVDAQDFAYDKNGNIVWETNATGNTKAGYHYHTIGWKFSVTQELEGRTNKKSATVYLGNAYSSKKTYAKSDGITVNHTDTYSNTYRISVEKLSQLTGLSMERGEVSITVDAVIEFYYKNGKGTCTSKHISKTKKDANAYCKKYGFSSNFNGSYKGYFGQTVVQNYFCLIVDKKDGIDVIKVNGSQVNAGKKIWVEKGGKVSLSARAATGYESQGWKGEKTSAEAKFSFQMPAHGVLTFAVAQPKVYRLTLKGNGGEVIRQGGADSDCILERYHTSWGYHTVTGTEYYWTGDHPSTNFSAKKTGFLFQGFFTEKVGGNKIVDENGTILASYTVFTADTSLYAHWTPDPNTPYKVQHWLQKVGAKSVITDSTNYELADIVYANGTTDSTVTPEVKTLKGFQSPQQESAMIRADGSTVINYYYLRNRYHISLQRYYGIENCWIMEDSTGEKYENEGIFSYGENLTLKAEPWRGYRAVIWTGDISAEGQEYSLGVPDHDMSIRVMASPVRYKIKFDGNGADRGEMSEIDMTYGISAFLPECTYEKEKYFFSGWGLAPDGEVVYTEKQLVSNLSVEEGGSVVLYAIWQKGNDHLPKIRARDRVFTVEQANNHEITEAVLFETAEAVDEEDGIILPGQHADNSFVLPDFDRAQIAGITDNRIVPLVYRAQDSAGNIVDRKIRIYVIQGECKTVSMDDRLRFISGKYLDAAPQKGGLKKNSIWKVEKYYHILAQLLKK